MVGQNFGATLGTATIEVQADLSKLDAQFAAAQRKWEQASAKFASLSKTAIDPGELGRQLAGQAEQAGEAAGKIGTAFAGASRASQYAIRNIAFQFSDLVVQVGAGTNVFRALAQQLPQVFTGFGPAAAIIGTLVTTVISLGLAFSGLGRSAKDSADDLKSVQDELAQAEERFRQASAAAKDFAAARLEVAQVKTGRELVDQQEDLANSLTGTLKNIRAVGEELRDQFGRDATAQIEALTHSFAATGDIEKFRNGLRGVVNSLRESGDIDAGLLAALKALTDLGDEAAITQDKVAQGSEALKGLAAGADIEGLRKIREEIAGLNEELSRFGAAPPAGSEQSKRFEDLGKALDRVKLKKDEFDAALKSGDTEATAPVLQFVDESAVKRQADAVDTLEKKIFDLGKTTERTRLPQNLQDILGNLEQLRQKVAGQAAKLEIHAELPQEDKDGVQRDLEGIGKQIDGLSSKHSRINIEVSGPKKVAEEIANLQGEIEAMQLAPSPGEAQQAKQRYEDIISTLKTLGKTMADFNNDSGVRAQVLQLVDTKELARQQEQIGGFQKKIQDLRNAIVIADLPKYLQAAAQAAADAGKNLATGDWNGVTKAVQGLAKEAGYLQSQLDQTEFGKKLRDLQQDADIGRLPPELREAAKAAAELGFALNDVKPDAIQRVMDHITRINAEFRENRIADQIREINNQAIIIQAPTDELRDVAQVLHDLGVDLSGLKTPEDLDGAIAKLSDRGRDLEKQFVAVKEAMRNATVRQDLAEGIKKMSDAARRAGVGEAFEDWAEKAQKLGVEFDTLGRADFTLVNPEDVEQLQKAHDLIIDAASQKIDVNISGLKQDLQIAETPEALKDAARYALETQQYLDEAGNVDFSQIPAEIKSGSAEAAKLRKQIEDAGRIEAGGRLPDNIDIANIAASELSQTLTHINELDFSNLDSAAESLSATFTDIAQQIVQAIIQALIFRAIMAGLGGGPIAPTAGAGGGFTTGPGGLLGHAAQGAVLPAAGPGNATYAPFAAGGLVPRLIMQQVVFPAAGGKQIMAGEAGPEAILPLARTTSGQLGVRVADDQPKRMPGGNAPSEADIGVMIKGVLLGLIGAALSSIAGDGSLTPLVQGGALPRGTGPILYRPSALGALLPRRLMETMGGGDGGAAIIRQPYAMGGLLPRTIMGQSSPEGGAIIYRPFAQGGLVPRLLMGPTVLHPAAGGNVLGGEAGPEAILPLERTKSGSLGVRVADKQQSTPSGNTVVFNIPDARPDTVAFALNQARRVFPKDTVEVASRSPNARARMGIKAPY